MTIDEIERRLRLPAPDEPSLLPALLLPVATGPLPTSQRGVALRVGPRRRSMPVLLLGAVLLLVAALVGTVLSGAFRLEYLRDMVPVPGLYTGRGITLDYPDDWHRLTPHDPFGSSGANVALVVGTRAVDGCQADSAAVERDSPPPQPTPDGDGTVDLGDQTGTIFHLEDRIYACLLEQPLEPGEVRVVLSRDMPQITGVGPFGDFDAGFLTVDPEASTVVVSAATGFTETIGTMPARLVVSERSVVPGAEQLRTWLVAVPGSTSTLWWVQAVLRGPDIAALEARVDAVARSLRFDDVPPPLEEVDQAAALTAAIDEIDRQMRQWPGRRFLACVPRTPGTRESVIEDGPRGRLEAPLPVTCSTSLEGGDLRSWQAEIEVAWEAGDGYEPGRWARRLHFDADGSLLQETDIAPGTGEPLAFPGDPGTQPVPRRVPAFMPGDLARAVGAGGAAAFSDVASDRLPPEPHLYAEPGRLLVIVAGPEEYDGRDFYLADDGQEFGWVGAEAEGVPVLAGAELRCPELADATDLAYLSPLELRMCLAGELVLEPVQMGRLESQGLEGVESDPAWLAGPPQWGVYGSGLDGLDRPLPVALDPALETLPTEGWFRIRGHVDDPASDRCRITVPPDSGMRVLPEEVVTRRCQERFVVTSVEPVAAP